MKLKRRRRICVILVDRANYGRLWPVMKEIKKNQKLELQVICSGTMVLDRFANTYKEVEEDGFGIDAKVYMEVEGNTPMTMAKSVGLGIVEFATELNRLHPDIVLLIGDRYEALSAAIAAAYSNIPIAHVQGGEVSGSIDESARHAITKFSHWHFPATQKAADHILSMGERRDCVFNYGCPVGDYILNLDTRLPDDVFSYGSGANIDSRKDFNLVIFHPVTTEYGTETQATNELLSALNELQFPTLFLWPNIDAGADHISREIRRYWDKNRNNWLRFIKNIPPKHFQRVLKKCKVAIGNSSSFVRDTTFMGTPVVLIGDRQEGRETGINVTVVPPLRNEILAAVRRQMEHGRYPVETIYGKGGAAKKIAATLAKVPLYVQKRLDYIYR